MPEYIHELAMLRLQNENIESFSNEQLFYEYKKITTELIEARKKCYDEHPGKVI